MDAPGGTTYRGSAILECVLWRQKKTIEHVQQFLAMSVRKIWISHPNCFKSEKQLGSWWNLCIEPRVWSANSRAKIAVAVPCLDLNATSDVLASFRYVGPTAGAGAQRFSAAFWHVLDLINDPAVKLWPPAGTIPYMERIHGTSPNNDRSSSTSSHRLSEERGPFWHGATSKFRGIGHIFCSTPLAFTLEPAARLEPARPLSVRSFAHTLSRRWIWQTQRVKTSDLCCFSGTLALFASGLPVNRCFHVLQQSTEIRENAPLVQL